MPSPTPPTRGRAREDTGERLSHPARPAHIPTPALRISHFPDPSPTTLEQPSPPRLDTEGSHHRAPSWLRLSIHRLRRTAVVGWRQRRAAVRIRSFLDSVDERGRHADRTGAETSYRNLGAGAR